MNKKGKILALLVVVLLASCANAPQGDNTPQYEKQVVELPGVSNARQLGGYIIGDKKVRMDLLLRSGNLSKASDEAIASLRDKYRLSLAADFSKSNISYVQDIEELTAVARAEGSEDELIEYIHLLRGVSVPFFEKTLDAIDARYGSIDNFLEQELELSADEKRILRDKFLENR